ncbi:MAG: GTPase Era [Bdellovibrionales bacterium]|nr:GTPase Era [Bdellovibrionales bacterium]
MKTPQPPAPHDGESTAAPFRSGFAALLGDLNAGKSTLLNRLAGSKVAIVTPKPQTTRNQIRAVRNSRGGQIVFLDTPGFVRGRRLNALNRELVRRALDAAADVDVRILVLDGSTLVGREERIDDLVRFLSREDNLAPDILVVNKVDVIEKRALLPLIAALDQRFAALVRKPRAIVPLSAATGDGVERLEAEVLSLLPEGPAYFPEGMTTDQPERFLAAELIREKLFLALREELPYCVSVRVEHWEEDTKILTIFAVISVERPSQKGMVIGKGGTVLKDVGTKARTELERLLGKKINLQLQVVVEKDWTKTARGMTRAGAGD